MYPNYCLEDLSTKANPNFILGIPEICFCDIPITMADLYLKKYGKYAIAFNKQWGIQSGCNPIQYVCNESIIDGVILRDRDLHIQNVELNNYFAIQGVGLNFDKLIHSMERNAANIYALGFLKKYLSDDNLKNNYINYNENEWRYILPEDQISGTCWFRSESDYLKWRGQNNYTSKKTGKLVKKRKKPEPTKKMKEAALAFTPKDINHILVYKENDIPDVISGINGLKMMGKCSLNDSEKSILISKISSFERIKLDF